MFAILLLPYIDKTIDNQDVCDNHIYNIIDIKKRPWLHNVDPQFIFTKNNISYVFDDVSIYYYLKYKNIKCDYIFGDDININQKIVKYTYVFLLFFDQIQAFHTLSNESLQKIKPLFLLPYIFPKYTFQHFIYHKNIYFNFLQKENIHILPFLYISLNQSNYHEKIKNFSIQNHVKKVYIKPIYGQNSKDHHSFHYDDLKSLDHYISTMKNKYNAFIIQPYIDYFYHQYEYRNFFIGNQYVYTIRTKRIKDNSKECIEEYVKMEDCLYIVEYAKRVFQKIEKKFFQNHKNLILRIDLSYDDSKKLFVSEIEFVPYLFTYIKEVNKLYIDQQIGDQMIQIISNKNNILTYLPLYIIILTFLIIIIIFIYLNIKYKNIILV